MKFRNRRTGEIYDDIKQAIRNFCIENYHYIYSIQEEIECESSLNRITEYSPKEAARLMGYEVVEEMRDPQLNEGEMDKEMEKNHFPTIKEEANVDKPRICDVLGVEVGEDFKYRHTDGTEENLCVCEDGRVIISSLSCKMSSTSVLINAINHPDRIIRKPRWTQQEVESAKIISVLFPEATHIERLRGSKVLGITGAKDGWIADIESSLFPEIKSGQSVTLDQIIGGAE